MNNRKNVIIIEFDYHAEVLINSLLILQTLPYNIILFTKSSIWSEINSIKKWDGITVFEAPNERAGRKLISSNIEIINDSNLILFNTLASNFKFFSSIQFNPSVVLRIHNANTYFNPTKSINLKFSAFYIWKNLSYLIIHGLFKFELFYRAKFVKNNVDYFLLPSQKMIDYVLNKNYVKPEKLLPAIPYVFLTGNANNELSRSVVNIVITGNIDKRRKDYPEVLRAFKSITSQLNTKATLTLLGRPFGRYGRTMVNAFTKLQTKFFTVNSFDTFVPQILFDETIKKADFLIVPTVNESRYKLYKELYGYTKISGGINDMVVYRKPALIPEFYPIEKCLIPHVARYSNENELSLLLLSWIENRKFEDHTISSEIKEFSFEYIAKKTNRIFKDIMGT